MAGGQWAMVAVVIAACIAFVRLVPFAVMGLRELLHHDEESDT